jgi:hypothetical protein
MHLIRWAAVIASGLLGLVLLFSVVEMETTIGSRVIRVILGLIGIAAAYGLHRAERWGKPGVIAFGLLLMLVGALSLTRGLTAADAAFGIVPGLIVAILGALSDTNGPLPPWKGTPPQQVGRPTRGGVSDASTDR